MKSVINGQSNKLLFIGVVDSYISSITCEFVQLGSDDIVEAPITLFDIDCSTTTFDVELSLNQLQNATYVMTIKGDDSKILYSTTVRAHGNTEEYRSYVVLDS